MMGVERVKDLMGSAVYYDKDVIKQILTLVQRATMCRVALNSRSPGVDVFNWLGEIIALLRQKGLYDERDDQDYLEEVPQADPVLAGDIKRALLKANPVLPEAGVPPASKARAFAVSKGTAAFPHVPMIPGTPLPPRDMLQDPEANVSPLDKAHSFLVDNVTSQVEELQSRLLLKECEDWASEQYPTASHGDFSEKAASRKADYDKSMKRLRQLLVLDSMYGDQMPSEARIMLQGIRTELEEAALTDLAYAKGSEAGAMCRLMVGKSSKSWLARYGSQVEAFMSMTGQQEKSKSTATKKRSRNPASQVDRQEVASIAEDKAATKLVKTAKENRIANESKSAAIETDNKQLCELCGTSHKGGFDGCAFNPASPGFNQPFARAVRERINRGQPNDARSRILRRAATSTSGGGRGKGGRGRGAGGAERNTY
jgi:hypothetical protein